MCKHPSTGLEMCFSVQEWVTLVGCSRGQQGKEGVSQALGSQLRSSTLHQTLFLLILQDTVYSHGSVCVGTGTKSEFLSEG